jgi:cell wall-associated NlpC family hydrolase
MARQGLARGIRVCAALAATTALGLPASAGAAGYAVRTLTVGSHGADVKKLQKYLTTVGLRTRSDGNYGRGTASNMKKFEVHAHKPADGRATPADQRALRAAAANGDPVTGDSGSTGGASYTVAQGNPTEKARMAPDGRTAIAPDSAPQEVKDAIAAANAITTKPYRYGGGHGSFQDSGYDCSGSVSYALHGGGFLDQPEDSTGLESFGAAGRGQWITVYANSGHAFAIIAGLRFDTSGDNQGETGPRWHTDTRSLSGYTVRHPDGF